MQDRCSKVARQSWGIFLVAYNRKKFLVNFFPFFIEKAFHFFQRVLQSVIANELHLQQAAELINQHDHKEFAYEIFAPEQCCTSEQDC